jgi:hypothetical protein
LGRNEPRRERERERQGEEVIYDLLIHVTGDVQRFRLGGHAMQPRQTLRRIIKIATIDDGAADRPFCGQKYFKACASVKYAMSMVESIGPWIEFQFAPGVYQLSSSLAIEYAGITLRGSGSHNDTILRLYQTLYIKAPSFRMINLTIEIGPQNGIYVNAGSYLLFLLYHH